jgi:hypothetical protein
MFRETLVLFSSFGGQIATQLFPKAEDRRAKGGSAIAREIIYRKFFER